MSEREKRTKQYYQVTYNSMVQHARDRGHNPPDFTKQEFKEWCLKQANFNTLFSNWIKSGFEKNLYPSVDRIFDNESYTFGNMQMMTYEENHLKQSFKRSKPVIQLDKEGNYLNRFKSIAEVTRRFNVSRGSIQNALKNKTKSAGFRWEYESVWNNNNNSS